MKRIALLVALVLVLVIVNPINISQGLCSEVGKAKEGNYLRMEKNKQKMAEYDKKIAELGEKAAKLRREAEEKEKEQRMAHRLFGIMIPPLGYVFWLFRYCP